MNRSKLLRKKRASNTLLDGLVAFYPFDGDAQDYSENGNDGTINGDPQFTEGVSGQALDFDGNGDYVEVPNHSSINMIDNFTISVWLKPDNTDGAAISKDNIATTGNRQYNINIRAAFGVMQWNTYHQDSTSFRLSTSYVEGEWVHIVAMLDSGMTKLFKNGSLDGSTSYSSPLNDHPIDIIFGARGGGGFEADTIIDEPRIYNRALTESEIEYLYNNPAG